MAVDVTMLEVADSPLSPRGRNGVVHPNAVPHQDDLDLMVRQTALCIASRTDAHRRSRRSSVIAVLATLAAGLIAVGVFWWLWQVGP